jgi:hypothetical protein
MSKMSPEQEALLEKMKVIIDEDMAILKPALQKCVDNYYKKIEDEKEQQKSKQDG